MPTPEQSRPVAAKLSLPPIPEEEVLATSSARVVAHATALRQKVEIFYGQKPLSVGEKKAFSFPHPAEESPWTVEERQSIQLLVRIYTTAAAANLRAPAADRPVKAPKLSADEIAFALLSADSSGEETKPHCLVAEKTDPDIKVPTHEINVATKAEGEESSKKAAQILLKYRKARS